MYSHKVLIVAINLSTIIYLKHTVGSAVISNLKPKQIEDMFWNIERKLWKLANDNMKKAHDKSGLQ